ncbi:peptidase M22, glycoprotease [Schizopora paradoxa]|uniref:N(6)-L-threonylcarbamoyladenine synthase n=1 Tax=Schizopora paradoxa TaxID=27342 RepID=A0A0H2RDB5_9AGAM|nr:peptidase M22, glycoprotease [Schizopora paradoxa]
MAVRILYWDMATTREGICSSFSLFFPCNHRWRFQRRTFTVLALESSADDTCAAVVNSRREILSNIVLKQHDQHQPYGGIQPLVAIKAHQQNMPIAVSKALRTAKLDMSQIDGVAFTRGPGINGCLSVCSNAAKTLAAALNKPLVGVHHMQAHALTPLLTSSEEEVPEFPFLTLLVSGGHTLLLLAESPMKFTQLATTPDEAIGRAIDKVARDIGLEWSSFGPGAALEKFCMDENLPCDAAELPEVPTFPSVMPGRLAFSFSGLHSWVDRYISQNRDPSTGDLNVMHKVAVARSFQYMAFKQLEEKLVLAIEFCERNSGKMRPLRHVVVSGGVASNTLLRKTLSDALRRCLPEKSISLVFPPPSLCTDNAAMIAWASMHRFLAEDYDDYSIDHRAKWNIEDLSR